MTSGFWDNEVEAPTHTSWMQPVEVRHYINELISGDRGVWPLEWLRSRLQGQRFRRALSIGCGTGVLERHLVQMNICERIDAFDASMAALKEAIARAQEAGLTNQIRYFRGDFNEPPLGTTPRYDAVFWHQSLHHVSKLEKLLRTVLRVATPGALLYLDEFIGPSRTDWNEKRVAQFQDLYEAFSPTVRWFDYMPFPIEWNDETEAARSSEIMQQLRVGFKILDFRGYGGNVLSVLWGALIPSRLSAEDLTRLITADREAVQRSRSHFHAVVLATPKLGMAARYARIRYYIAPKVRFVARRLRRLVLRETFRITHERKLLHPELTKNDGMVPYRDSI